MIKDTGYKYDVLFSFFKDLEKLKIWRYFTLCLCLTPFVPLIFLVVGNFGSKQRQLLSSDHFQTIFSAKNAFFWRESQEIFPKGQEESLKNYLDRNV